jgi:hypothetical protein
MQHKNEHGGVVRFLFVPANDESAENVFNCNRGEWSSAFDRNQRCVDRRGFVLEVAPWPALDERVERELRELYEEQRRETSDPPGTMRCNVVPAVPSVINDALVAIASSGLTAGVLALIKTWVDARNGRKLKIKVGDIEVEATQMKEEDVLRIFELLEEKADRKKIRELLLNAGKGGGRPEA